MTTADQLLDLEEQEFDGAPADRPGTRLGRVLRSAGRNWSALLAAAVLVIIILWAIVPGWFTSANPIAIVPGQTFQPPSAAHWFGTDELGRDMFTRVVYGSRASLSGSAVAVAVGVVAGSAFGALAGWFRGWVDVVIMRVMDVVLSIPGFLLAVTIIVLLGFGILQAAIAVGVTSSASFARLIRSEVLRARTSLYVEAAVTGGARSWTILRRHVIPNSIAPTLSLITIRFGTAIIWIASLSFIGLGAQPPSPEWGLLVADGRTYMAARPWLTLFPSLVIVVMVFASNHLARWIAKRQQS
jgi:peptide/nickel transport system permease protein